MTESHPTTQANLPPPAHNGQLLSEIYGVGIRISLRDAADKLDIARSELSDILSGKAPISLPIALRIAEHFGGSAVAWQRNAPAS